MTQQRRFTKEFEEEAVRLVQTNACALREIAGANQGGGRPMGLHNLVFELVL
jgi:hypothetical protein